MRYFLITIFITALLFGSAPAAGAQQTAGSGEPDSGSVVCPPMLYVDPGDCLPLGPSQTLAVLADQGLPYPTRPLPAYLPPFDLTRVDFRYFKADPTAEIPLSLAPGAEPSGYIQKGLVYLSYIDVVEVGGGTYLQRRGEYDWFAGRGSRGGYSEFQGLEFSRTPQNGFGWVLQTTTARSGPSFSAPETKQTFYRYNIVQIYQSVEAESIRWFQVAPGVWVDGRWVSRVIPRYEPPPGIQNGRWIDINLEEQTLAVYEENQLVFATLIATGTDPYWTRPGLFQIYEKVDSTNMSGSFESDRSDYYYLEDVPWTMYFDQKRALHGAYWRTLFGYEQSHGCVNLSVGDSHWLYDWAQIGDWVFVYDPSGRTPTDDKYYSEGGA